MMLEIAIFDDLDYESWIYFVSIYTYLFYRYLFLNYKVEIMINFPIF